MSKETPTDEEMLLASAVANAYRDRWGQSIELDFFRGQNGFWYLMDNSDKNQTDEAQPANRVVAAWGYSRPDALVGDRNWMKRFPLPVGSDQRYDRGHLVALAAGGGDGINLVPQAKRLNRGWSEPGQDWRALERLCIQNPGTFLFIRVDYKDLTDIPSGFDYQLSTPTGVKKHSYFDNSDF